MIGVTRICLSFSSSTLLDSSANAFSGSINFVHKERKRVGERELFTYIHIHRISHIECIRGAFCYERDRFNNEIRSKAFCIRYACAFNAKQNGMWKYCDSNVPLTQKFDLCPWTWDKRRARRVEGAALSWSCFNPYLRGTLGHSRFWIRLGTWF